MFVCQCKEDYDTLNRHINDNPGLGRKARIPIWFRPGTEQDLTAPPMDRAELEGRGFDGYALEYVDCAEGLKWFLKRELNMHRTVRSPHVPGRRGADACRVGDLAQGRAGRQGRDRGDGATGPERTLDQHELRRREPRSPGYALAVRAAQYQFFCEYPPPSAQLWRTDAGCVFCVSLMRLIRDSRAGSTVNPMDKKRIDDRLVLCKREAAEIEEEERELSAENHRLKALHDEQQAKLVRWLVCFSGVVRR
jgi:hypothetical protein